MRQWQRDSRTVVSGYGFGTLYFRCIRPEELQQGQRTIDSQRHKADNFIAPMKEVLGSRMESNLIAIVAIGNPKAVLQSIIARR